MKWKERERNRVRLNSPRRKERRRKRRRRKNDGRDDDEKEEVLLLTTTLFSIFNDGNAFAALIGACK